MVILSADNRSLLAVAPYTYLVDNTAAGTHTISVLNVDGITAGSLILIGMFGNEAAELFRVGTVSSADNTIELLDKSGGNDLTSFAHPESTKISVIPFNEIRFFWTAATGTIADENPTFDTSNPLTGWQDIVPSEWFTTYNDASHSTGFGWFLFRNSISTETSQNSNAIPYAGFATNTAQYVIQDFMSLLNNRELKLVNNDDMFSWLNEGVNLVYNKLNLTNTEYTVSTPISITLVAGTAEYQLQNDFGDLVQITTSGGIPIEWVSIKDAMANQSNVLRYYIRGRYLGFVPTPDAVSVQYNPLYYRYRSKGSRITSLDDVIDLPDNGANVVKDWMMWRACLKFQNPNAQIYYKSFNDGMNQLIVSAIKRDANLDTWGIAGYANA